MKQVIVICFMAISLCLSAPQGNSSNTEVGAPAGTPTAAPTTQHPASLPPITTQAPEHDNTTKAKNAENTTAVPSTTPHATEGTTAPSSSPTPTIPTIPTHPTNNTSIITTSSVKPVTVSPKPNNEVVPTKASEPAKVQTARGFDGGSFVGGIILTLGLLAIGFMGFKYYKNQTERNYHTL